MALKQYSNEVFEHLVKCFRDKDEDSQKWLAASGFPELYHLVDAIDGMELSFRWLLENNCRHFAAVVDGLSGKDAAKAWLLQSGYAPLAAFIDACDGSAKAIAFLIKSNQQGWVLVAKEIYKREKKKEKSFFWNFLNLGNPFR